MNVRYFEDFEVGDSVRTRGVTLTESAIIDFALRYDPQPFHIDKAAAADSMFGGLIASGWHVGAQAFRMFVETGFIGPASLGSPGIEEVRWLKPVRPGDTISMAGTVTELRPSSTRDDRGYMTLDYEVRNQSDDVVMTFRGVQILRRRPTGG